MTDERRPDDREEADPGAFLGTGGEWAADSIPDGPQPGDERVAGTATQSSGVGALDRHVQGDDAPSGHRQGESADDDRVREAGQNQ